MSLRAWEFLVDDDDAGGNAGAVEQIGGQADDRRDIAAADKVAADPGLGVAAEQHAVRQDAGALAGGFQGPDDVQQIGVVPLLGRRRAEGLEALVRVGQRVDPRAPALVGEGGIGHDIVEGAQHVAFPEAWIGQGVALHDLGAGIVVQDHVHAREAGGRGVFLLPVDRDRRACGVGHFQQQGPRPAGGIVDRGLCVGFGLVDTQHLGDDAADLGGGVELALALAAFGGEVAHEVFVGVAQDVVPVGAVLGEIQRRVFEDGDEVRQALHLLPGVAELGGVVEVRPVGQFVGVKQRRDDAFVDVVADVMGALEGDHVLEAGALGDGNRRVGLVGVFVADVFDEQQNQDVVLVLAGIHAATQLVAALPEGGVEFGFLQCHADSFAFCPAADGMSGLSGFLDPAKPPTPTKGRRPPRLAAQTVMSAYDQSAGRRNAQSPPSNMRIVSAIGLPATVRASFRDGVNDLPRQAHHRQQQPCRDRRPVGRILVNSLSHGGDRSVVRGARSEHEDKRDAASNRPAARLGGACGAFNERDRSRSARTPGPLSSAFRWGLGAKRTFGYHFRETAEGNETPTSLSHRSYKRLK